MLNRKYHPAFPLFVIGFLLLLLSLACNLPAQLQERFQNQTEPAAPTPLPTPTPQPLPPTVVETDPAPGSSISLNQPIKLYFNQDMDPDSVEAALRGEPALSGKLVWRSPSVLEYQPDQSLPADTTQVIRLETSAQAENGLAFQDPFSVTFSTPDHLRPVSFLPAPDTAAVDPASAVVVTFNMPVIPLGESSLQEPGFEIDPPAEGSGEWINTSTYLFSPSNSLAGGTTYQVQLNTDLTSLAGTELSDDSQTSWSFTTVNPRLQNWSPTGDADNVDLDQVLQLTFNQGMDPDSVAANLKLISESGDTIRGKLEWSDDLREVEFTPDQLLERDTRYSVVLPGETRSAGGTILGEDTSWAFETVGELRFMGTPGGQMYTPSSRSGPTLYFSSPLNMKDLEYKIEIIPEITGLNPNIGSSDNVLNIYGNFQPLTDYTLILDEELEDRWGSTLGQPVQISFTTAPLRPQLSLTLRMNELFLSGEETFLPVTASSLYSVSLNVGSIPAGAFATVLNPDFRYQMEDYFPADVQYWTEILNVPGDDSYPVQLPLNPAETALTPGLYRYQVTSRELDYNAPPFLLAVSNLHLTMKVSPYGTLIWAVDLRDNQPAAETDIQVFDSAGRVLAEGKTDGQGIFESDFTGERDIRGSYFYAVSGQPGEENFGIAVSNWSSGTEPYKFNIQANYRLPDAATHIYTDRPIYRPGQTVHYRVIKRLTEPQGYTLPEDETFEVKIRTTSGEEIIEQLPVSDYGTAQGEFQISEFARPGLYTIYSENGAVNFEVANYRKPEIDLSVSLAQDQGLEDDPLEAEVNAAYYFDAPASRVPLTWSLRAVTENFYLPGYQVGSFSSGWFGYARFSYGSGYGSVLVSGEGETDADGDWSLTESIPLETSSGNKISLPARYTLEVTAADESGFPVSSRGDMVIHPEEFYIGVKPTRWVAEAGEEMGFDIKVVDWEKQPVSGENLRAEFSRVTWKSEYDQYGFVNHERQTELISSSDFSPGLSGEGRIEFTPDEPGTYQLTVSGGEAVTKILVWVSGPGSFAWPVLEEDKIKLVPDQDNYLPGETAEIFIPNPFSEGAQALITVEREEIVSSQAVEIQSSGEIIDIPLGELDIPNVYVAVTLLGKNSQGRADFRQGYLNLLVEPADKIFQVSVVGKPEVLEPREEVTFTLRVTDQEGDPVQGEFSLAVVDQAVLALTDPYAEDIDDAFFSVRPLSVRMGIPLGIHPGRKLIIGGGMGGGGGETDRSIRTQFEDTGYWNAEIITDSQGMAEVTLSLPDNLTTWQAEARGITQDTLVGQGTAEVVTTKQLLVRPVMPRFLVAGDHLELAAVVHNNTDRDLEVTVDLQGTGFVLDEPLNAAQQISLPAGDRSRVSWWGTVADSPEADLTISAAADGLQDAVTPYQGPLPILRYTAPQTYGTAGYLEEPGQELEVISLPRTFIPGEGSLEIELSPSLAGAVISALEALDQDQIYSNIQAVSFLVPHAVTYQTLQDLALDYPGLESRINDSLTATLDKLEAAQNDDGGWGWWERGGSSTEVTSYILYGLVKTQQAGIFVDEIMLENARGYLLASLPAVDMLNGDLQLDRLAFQYFALNESGIENLGGLSDLYSRRSELSPASRAFLALTLEDQDPGSEEAAVLLSDLAGTAEQTATGIHWESPQDCRCGLNNTTSTTAIALYALSGTDSGEGLLADGVRYLVSTRTVDGDWRSYYETSWAVLALSKVLEQTGELESSYSYSAAVNGREVISGQAAGADQLEAAQASLPIADLYAQDPNALTLVHGEGEGNLYYTAHLQVYRPASEVTAFGSDLSLSRVYAAESREGESAFVQGGRAGELIQVQLTLTLEKDSYYLTVEDYFPAGAEILDTRLKTTQQAVPEFASQAPFRDGWGWWYFNNPRVFDDHVSWDADYLPAGTYQMNYLISLAHPGEFQVLPARAQEVFFPETQAVSSGDLFIIEKD